MKQSIFQNIVVFALVIFVFGSSSTAIGQDKEKNEPKLAVVPSHVMKEVVGRILRSYFKPRVKEKTIYLSGQNIESSWLPAIRNVSFQLLTDAETKQRDDPFYFFHPAVVFEKGSEIGFSYGNPSCGYSGDSWYFRAHPNRIEIRNHGSHGRSCPSHGELQVFK